MMSLDTIKPIQVAAEVLGCDARSLIATQVKGGLTNESWYVDAANTSVVVRISTADEHALQLNRANEALVLRLVEQAGIGAEVLLCEPSRRLLVTRKLMAEPLMLSDLRDPALLPQLANLLRVLHQLSIPDGVQAVYLQHVLHGYWQTLAQHRIALDEAANQQALTYALESDQIAPRQLCHHDVHHLNLLSDGKRLWLLDWEYAGLGDPLFDLAAVCCYHDYDVHLRGGLLLEYRGYIDPAELDRLHRMCWLFDYIKELWMQVRNLPPLG